MSLKDRWVSHPWLDLLAALIGVSLLFVDLKEAGFYELAGAVAGTSGVLLGMAAVVYGLFQQSSSDRVRALRVAYRSDLRSNWSATFIGFVIVCAVALLAMPAWAVSEFATKGLLGAGAVFMIARAARMVWLLQLYLKVDAADSLPTLPVRNDIAQR